MKYIPASIKILNNSRLIKNEKFQIYLQSPVGWLTDFLLYRKCCRLYCPDGHGCQWQWLLRSHDGAPLYAANPI